LPETVENKKEKMEILYIMRLPLLFLGYPEVSLGLLQQGERLSKELGDERCLARFYNAMGLYYSHKGDPQLGMKYSEAAFDEGKTYLEKGLRNASEINNLVSLGFAELQYGLFYIFKGDWEPSKERFEKGIKHNEEAKYVLNSAFCWVGLGYACTMLGDPETGKRYAERGLEIQRDSGAEVFLSMAHCLLGWIRLDLGDLKNARSHAEEALRLSQKNNEKAIEGWSWLFLGMITGKTEPLLINKAQGCILKGIEICKQLKIKPFYSLGHLYLGQLYLNGGEKKKALENLKTAEGMFQEMGMDYWLARTKEVMERL